MGITKSQLSKFSWLNEPDTLVLSNQNLQIEVGKGTDFFNNPEDSSIVGNAPFLHINQSNDFVAKAYVTPDFSSQWNAFSLMVYIDSLTWIKHAFENSDATGPTVVTVVTKRESDDANGVILNSVNSLWLALAKKGNIYSMHWSIDGKDFKMSRLTKLPEATNVKIGVEFQSPVGESARHILHHFQIEEVTVPNLRNLNVD